MWKPGKFLASFGLLVAITLLLAGCGEADYSVDEGADYSSSELLLISPQIQPSLVGFNPSYNELFFYWSQVEGADKYLLSVNPDGRSGYVLVEERAAIPEGQTEPSVGYYARFPVAIHLFDWANALFMLESCVIVDEVDVCEIVGYQSAGKYADQISAGLVTTLYAPPPEIAFGIDTAISGNGEIVAVGANQASYIPCDAGDVTFPRVTDLEIDAEELAPCAILEVRYCHDDPFDPENPGPCLKLSCDDDKVPDDAEPDEQCEEVEVLPECTFDGVEQPGVDCSLPFCEASADDEPGINCILPDCEDADSEEPGVPCFYVPPVPPECGFKIENEPYPADCTVFEDIDSAGMVYIYTQAEFTNNWVIQASIKAPNPDEFDNFGWSVALSDDGAKIAIGAFGEDGAAVPAPDAENNVESAGAAYLFEKNVVDDEWEMVSYIKASDAAIGDGFGWDVALSGDGEVLAVSAAPKSACEGAVYTFTPDVGNEWMQQALFTAPESQQQQNDVFGQSLSLDYTGSLLAVGASQSPYADLLEGCALLSNPVNNTGVVHLFERDIVTDAWSPLTELRASNAGAGDRFGYSLAFNGGDGYPATRLVVGAPQEDSSSTGINGPQGNDEAGNNAGAAYLFENKSGIWEESLYLKASYAGIRVGDGFGIAVDINRSGEVLAVGAWGEDAPSRGLAFSSQQEFNEPYSQDSGAVYVFKEDILWEQKAFVKSPYNQTPGVHFGANLQIADPVSEETGKPRLIVGAPAFLSSPVDPLTGVRRKQVGTVYIY